MENRPPLSLSRYHQLLGVQSLVVILISVNRLSSLTRGYVASNQFLRWVDLNNMLVLPLISVIAFYLLKKQVEINSSERLGSRHLAVNVAFLVGVYLLAAGYGAHEVTNYLHVRFCLTDETSALCQIIIFNDDEFSHWVFFAGFVLVNGALMLLQALFPYRGERNATDLILLAVNGIFIGAGIFANLAFETIGLDLYIVAFLAVMSIWLIWRRGLQPLWMYYATAYSLGLIGTWLYKALV